MILLLYIAELIVVGCAGLSSAAGTVRDYSPNTCRSDVEGSNNYRFSWFKEVDSEDPLLYTTCCSNNQIYNFGTYYGTCREDINKCNNGFALSMWLKQIGTTVTESGSYLVSTGGQRSESCGFYVRLNSINQTANNAVFDVGISTTNMKWHVLFVAQIKTSMHLIVTWKDILGLDIYVDGQCAGSQIQGVPRDPIPTCGKDDPFRDFLVGRRNDKEEGFSYAEIGRLYFYLSWQEPAGLYDAEMEGAALTYYQRCIEHTASLSSLTDAPDHASTTTYSPASCRSSCLEANHRYATLTPLTEGNIDCFCLDSITESVKVDDSLCSTICPDFYSAKCGASGPSGSLGYLSVYITSAFDYFLGTVDPISGFDVEFVGIDGFTVITGQSTQLRFIVDSGNNAAFFVYGDQRVEEVETSEETAHLVFPSPGTYHMTAVALNAENRQEVAFTVILLPDSNAIKHLTVSGGIAEVNRTSKIQLNLVEGKEITCHVNFGDDQQHLYYNSETIDQIEHVYSASGVYEVNIMCTAGYSRKNSSASMVVIEPTEIELTSSYKVVYGNDQLISFALTGTNISEVNVTFDGSPLDLSCDETWNCEVFLTSVDYDEVGSHVISVTAGNGITSTITAYSNVYIGNPVDGLVVDISTSHVFVNDSFVIETSIANGTDIFMILSVGDVKQVYVCERAPCFYNITIILPTPGMHTIQVEASNDLTVKMNQNVTIMIYNHIPSMTMIAQSVNTLVEAVTVQIAAESGAEWPNGATISLILTGTENELPFIQNERDAFVHTLNPTDYGVFIIKANVSNPLEHVEFQCDVQIGSLIDGLNIEIFPDFPIVDKDTDIVIEITDGNPLTLDVAFGDGEMVSFYHDISNSSSSSLFQTDGPSRSITLTHIYQDVGDYAVNITADNVIGTVILNTNVTINRELEGLSLITDALFVSPNDPFEMAIVLNESAPLPWNASCYINYGDGTTLDDLVLNVTHSENQILAHTYTEPHGNLTVKVVCSNKVSIASMSVDIAVIATISNCALDGPSFVATGSVAGFSFSLDGSHIDLNISYGDGNTLMEKLTRLPSDDYVFTMEHTYSQPGLFNIISMADNLVSNCTSNITLNVLNPIVDGNFILTVSPEVIDIKDSTVTCDVTLSEAFAVPSHVTMLVDFDDDTTETISYPLPDGKSLKHSYSRIGTFVVSIVFQNLVSKWTLSKNVIVMEKAREIQFDVSSALVAVGDDVIFTGTTKTGSNLTYTIKYGDGNSDVIFKETAEPVAYSHKYTVPGHYEVTFEVDNLLGHLMDNTVSVHVVTPINGLVFKAEPDVIYSPGSVNLVLSQDPGNMSPTEMTCTVIFGDSSTPFVATNVKVSESSPATVAKSYPGGLFDVLVTCRNPLGETNLSTRVKIYEKISILQMNVDDAIIKIGTEVTFTVSLSAGSFVIFSMEYGDGSMEHRNITQSEDANFQSFTHRYIQDGNFEAKVVVSNGIATENGLDFEVDTIDMDVLHGTDMFQLSAESSGYIPPGEVRFILSVPGDHQFPSEVSLDCSFGDGKSSQVMGYFNGSNQVTTTHVYDYPGMYDVSITVSNAVESNTYTTEVLLRKKAPPLSVYIQYTDAEDTWLTGHGPDLNWMPVKTELKFFGNTSFQDLDTIWSFGDDTEDITSPTAFHVYQDPGWYNVTLKLRNTSHIIIEEYFDLYIVSDPVTLRLATIISEGSNEDIWIGRETTFLLEATIPPGPSCVSWAMGDSSPIVIYGPAPCVEQVVGDNMVFVEIDRYSLESFSHKHVYHTPGYFKVRVGVENYLTLKNITVKEILTVKGCSKPIQVTFTGTGQDMYHPRQFLRSERIPLDPLVHFPCVGVENPIFAWTAKTLVVLKGGFTLPVDYVIDPFERPKRTFPPLTFKAGLYEVILTVSVPEHPAYTNMDSIFLDIEETPLQLVIVGGTSRAVGSVEPLKVDAVSLSNDPDDPERDPNTWRFVWSCFRVTRTDITTSAPISTEMEDIPRKCDAQMPELLDTTSGVIELDAMTLRVGSIYNFRVKAYAGNKGKKIATAKQVVVIERGDLPAVYIKCVTNCKGKMNPTSSFALQGSCTNCPDTIVKYLTYKWHLYVLDDYDYVKVANLSEITSTGDMRAGLNFVANRLDVGKQYRLRLSIQPPSGTTGYSEFTFKTNLPPFNGTCRVSPPTGFAISTRFSVECTDWMDEGNSVERPSPGDYVDEPYLHYKVLQRPRGAKSYSLMYSGVDRLVSGLVFGTGPPAYNHTFELKVQVVDKFGAKAEKNLTIKVTEKVLEAEELDTLIGSNSSHLQQLIAAGDAEGATQLITAVLSVLSDQENTTSEFTEEEVKQIQSDLLEELIRVSVWADTIEDLYSAASALSKATGGSAHAQALFNAALTMAAMASKLESVSDQSPEEVLHTAEGLTDALGNLMTQSEDIVNSALVNLVELTDPTTEPEEEGDEYAPGALDPELAADLMAEEMARKAVELEGARFAAKTISEITEKTLDNVANVLCSQQVSGQPPVVMDSGTVKAEFYVEEKDKMGGRDLAIGGGSCSLPSADVLFADVPAGNLKQKLYAFNANPHAYDTSSLEVGSEGTIKLDFETENNDRIDVQNLTSDITIIIENKNKLVPVELVFWNSTVNYRVELPSNASDIHLIVKPINITDVKVYVKYAEQVNATNYDYVFKIPRNLTEQETWSDEEIREEARYSVWVPSANGTGAGIYYVAIALPLNLSIWDTEEDLPTADLPTATLSMDAEYLPTVDLTLYVAGCRYWNEAKGGWIPDGCRSGPLTNSRYTQCLCNHLSDFASSFFVPPNSIDFSTVFSKFKNLGDNAAVFSTCFALFGVYLILLVWLRRKDKQDVIKWGVTPLADNQPEDKYYYQVTIETGMRPGSGTSSKVGLIISGDLFDTGPRLIDDDKREVFGRGSVCHFLMAVDGNLGPLSYLKVWHDNSGEGEMAGWYLSKVAVLDIQTGEHFYFICERWLAVEQDDGAVDRVCPVATKSDLTQFSQLFFSGSREKLFDDHLWFSLFTRPTRSHFTRVQRLSCCLSLLYCSMIANAMFYRSEENVEKTSSIRLGPFIFSGQQVFVGFISALVVVPINVAIVQIFRKSKPSKKDRAYASLPEDAKQKLEELENPKKQKSKEEETKILDEKEEPEPEAKEDREPEAKVDLPQDPEMITEEEFALRKAYKPKEYMSMIDEEEEYQQSGSTETIPMADNSLTESMNDMLNCQSTSASHESVHKVDVEQPANQENDVPKTEKPEKKKKEEFMLPHWCVYIGWFLFAISCLVSAFFTILYSLEWGAEKSQEWLTAMLLSFFNSVVVIQPMKVLVIVTILSIIFRKPAKMDPEADNDLGSLSENQLNSDEEFLHKTGDNQRAFPFMRKPLSKEELEQARKRRFQEIRMYSIVRETIIYTIYVCILLILCYSNRDTLAFYVSKSIRDNFVNGDAGENTTLKLASLSKSTPDLFWDWMDKSIIPGLYGETYYNGEPMHWRHTRFLSDFQSYRVGPARLRQLRVTSEHCTSPDQTAFVIPDCYKKYSSDNEQESSFSIGWQPPQNKTYEIGKTPEFIPDDEQMPWKYQDALDLNGVPFAGKRTLYGGGGFVAEFGVSMDRAYEISRFLRDNNWYDALTRAIFLEFTVYNANTNLFSVAQILVELPTTGGGVVSNYVHTFRLYHYAGGAAAIISVVFQLLFVAYIIYFTVKLILKIRKEGKKELLSFWTVVELVTLFMAFTAVGLFAIRQIFIYFSLKEVRNKNEGKFVNFAHIAKWDELFGYIMAFLAYLAILRYMRLLRLSPRMLMFGLTMSTASAGIICFSVMFSVMFFAFGQMGNMLFGHSVYMYSSLLTTMETLFAMMLGAFEFEPLRQTNGILGPIFFIAYICSMFFILSNMFIILISDAFADVNETTAEDTGDGDTEMVDFMMYKLKAFLRSFGGGGGGKKPKTQEPIKEAEPTQTSPNDLIESRVEQLLDFVTRNYGDIDLSSDGDSVTNSSASLSGIGVRTVASPGSIPKSKSRLRSKPILVC